MTRKQPIYVQAEISTTMDTLWEYTQNPALHTEWDIRFTDISYLPKNEQDDLQQFLYMTKIGFGIEIDGTGETVGQFIGTSGERMSSLYFQTKHPLSLIKAGRGYWKYTPSGERIKFETQYDYETAFGKMGEVIDRLLFRPLLGKATAWSFDALRLWIEKGYHPKLLIRQTLTYWLICITLAFVWGYQGLVPKVIAVHPEEVELFYTVVGRNIDGDFAVRLIGLGEIAFGLLWLLPFKKKRLFLLHGMVIFGLTVLTGIGNSAYFFAPFNPITLNVPLFILSLIGYLNSGELPDHRRCKRNRKG